MSLLDIDDYNFSDSLVESELSNIGRLVADTIAAPFYKYSVVRQAYPETSLRPARIEFNLRGNFWPFTFDYKDKYNWNEPKSYFLGRIYVYVEAYYTEYGEPVYRRPFFNVVPDSYYNTAGAFEEFLERLTNNRMEYSEQEAFDALRTYRDQAESLAKKVYNLLLNIGLADTREVE